MICCDKDIVRVMRDAKRMMKLSRKLKRAKIEERAPMLREAKRLLARSEVLASGRTDGTGETVLT